MSSSRTYVLIHFQSTAGGFRKRIEMLLQVLQQRCHVERAETLWAFLRVLCGRRRGSQRMVALIYGSLMAPCVVLLRLRWRDMPVYYMVRGDEATYAIERGRPIRAYVAVICQKILRLLECYFVFVSEDLRAVCESRLGPIRRAGILPNSIGRRLPAIRRWNGRIALVGDFGTVKNTEWAIENLSGGKYEGHLYGARTLPEKWRRSWLINHGIVADLTEELTKQPALLLLPYVDAGFPNVIVEALQAGCPIVVHDRFPFR